ncbi:MAG: hypothetical protein ACTSXW_06830 [Candidatus Baldrarchaeia archaeon]
MTYDEFWENVFSNLGFEKTVLADRPAFKIPIHEAIYLCQILGTTEWRIKKESRGEAYVFLDNDQILIFPNPCPSVRIGDVTTEIKYQGSIEHQINPLLSPSLNFIREKHPEFFDKDFKYLMFNLGSGAVKDVAKEENLNTSDIISLNLPVYKEDMNEALMTYIVSSFLRKKGFIVDPFNEVLGFGSNKYPDLFAFKVPKIQNKLINLGIVEGGFYLNELELMQEKEKFSKTDEEKMVVIEVESPTPKPANRFSGGKNQILQCLNGGYFNEGYVAVPFLEEKAQAMEGKPEELGFIPEEEVGIITLDRQGNILLKGSPKYGKAKNVSELLEIVERIIKLTLLKNLSLKQVFDLFPEARSFYDLYFAVDGLDINEIIISIKR